MNEHRPGTVRKLRVLISRNTTRRRAWPGGIARIVVILAAVVLSPIAPAAWAQDEPAQIAAPRVDWAHAKQAHRLAEQWVAAGAVAERAEPIRVTDLTGVKVTLRWLGMSMGSGEYFPDPRLGGGVGDLADATRNATSRALSDLEDILRQQHLKAMNAANTDTGDKPTPLRATPKLMTVADVGPKLTVDLQVGLRYQSIRLNEDDANDALMEQFAPGFHALHLIRPEGFTGDNRPPEAWLWPATALAANMSPSGQIGNLLAAVGLPPGASTKIARPGGATLDRFEVIHMVRPTRQDAVLRLVRGNVVLPPRAVNTRTLDEMVARLGAHLLRRSREDGQVAGTYFPSEDVYDKDSPTAPDEELALAAYTLTRFAAFVGDRDAALGRRVDAETAARRMVEWLSTHGAREGGLRPGAAGLLLMTLCESPNFSGRKKDRDTLGAHLLTLRNPDGTFRAEADTKSATLAFPEQAVVLASLTSLFEQTRDGELGVKVRASRDRLWKEAGDEPQRVIAGLPWLMLVEARRDLLDGAPDGEAIGKAREVHAARIKLIMESIRELQVQSEPQGPAAGPADVVGGFEWVASAPGGPPNPDWRTAYVVAFFAQAARTPGVIEGGERLNWILSAGLGARFLAQLMFAEPSCYYLRSQDDAIGGVRQMLWDNRLSVTPTALSLLAALELQQTLSDVVAEGELGEAQFD